MTSSVRRCVGSGIVVNRQLVRGRGNNAGEFGHVSIDPEGPYGAKEAGEGPLHPSIPAIANAIYDAIGVRLDAMPFSPPHVWRALNAQDARAAWERARTPSRTTEVAAD